MEVVKILIPSIVMKRIFNKKPFSKPFQLFGQYGKKKVS
jgi:hypothetical protein